MSGHIDSDRLLDSWFAEGPTELPDRAIDSIVSQLDEHKQRRPFWLPGRQRMNRMLLAGAGVAAVLVLALVGIRLYSENATGTGGGQPSSTASPSRTPSPSPTASPSPTRSPSPTVSVSPSRPGDGSLPEGSSHVLWDETQGGLAPGLGIKIVVTIPAAGWFGEEGGKILIKGTNVDAPSAPDGAGIIVFAHTNDLLVGLGDLYVYEDPCHWASTKPADPVTTVDEAIASLSGQASRDPSTPADITLDGYSGKRVTLHVPDDAVFSECDQGEFRTLVEGGPSRYAQDPGQFDLLWVLDVSGELVIIDITYYAGTPESVLDELSAIVESATLDYVP